MIIPVVTLIKDFRICGIVSVSMYALCLTCDNQRLEIQLATHSLPYTRLRKMPNHYIFTLKMATIMFGETSDNF